MKQYLIFSFASRAFLRGLARLRLSARQCGVTEGSRR